MPFASDPQKLFFTFSLALSLLLAGICFAFGHFQWGASLTLGSLAGLWNFRGLYQDLAQVYEAQGNVAKKKVSPGSFTGRFLSRYLLLGLAFFAAFKIPQLHFLSFAAGFTVVHVILTVSGLVKTLRSGN